MSPVPANVQSAEADIQAIMARTDIDLDGKRVLIYQRRAKAVTDHFTFNFQTSKTVLLTDADGVHWTISATGLSWDGAKLFELFGLRVLRNGVDLDVDPHLQVVNPPCLYPDPAGNVTRTYLDFDGTVVTKKYRVDPAACVLDYILGTFLEEPV